MAFYGYRAFGPYAGLGAFAFYGEGVVGDIGFDEPQSAKDWPTTLWGNPDLARPGAMDVGSIYTPLGSSDIERARAQWRKLQELIDNGSPSAGRAAARLDALRNELLGPQLIPHIDAITRSRDYASWAPNVAGMSAGARERAGTYKVINARLLAFANEVWPDAQADLDAGAAAEAARAAAAKASADTARAAQAKAAADAAAAAARLKQTQASIEAARAAVADAQQAKAVAEASAQKNRELQAVAMQKSAMTAERTPWVLGGLALLSAGAVYFARRKK